MLNLNEPDYIHRIELCEKYRDITMMLTQITDTYDLFALVNIDQVYQLYMIDLDNQDLTKYEEISNDPFSLYYKGVRSPVLQYHESEVDHKTMVNMHCRGSSRKQLIDFDEKLMVLLLHEHDLYIWVKLDHFDHSAGDGMLPMQKIRLIQTISSK